LEPYKDKTQLNREFFVGHKAPVIYIFHIENGQDMVSIDEQGCILIWTYNKEYLNSE
jgi:hypothetical protein